MNSVVIDEAGETIAPAPQVCLRQARTRFERLKRGEYINRFDERRATKLLRSRKWERKARLPYLTANAFYWHRRVIKAFKGNERVEASLFSGKLDRALRA